MIQTQLKVSLHTPSSVHHLVAETYTEENGKGVYAVLCCRLRPVNTGEWKFLYCILKILNSRCVLWTLNAVGLKGAETCMLICLYSFFSFVTQNCILCSSYVSKYTGPLFYLETIVSYRCSAARVGLRCSTESYTLIR
jgi:hypothetical protein